MARPRKETDLKGQMLTRYEELLNERNKMEGELKGLEVYLKAVGEIRGRRGPRKRSKQESPVRRAPISKGAKKVSATEAIVSLIGKSEKGISIDEIMKQTGLSRNTVNGVLNRMKRENKVKAVKRGVYVKQSSGGGSAKQKQRRSKKTKAVAEKSATIQKKAPKPKAKTPAKKPSRVRARGKGAEKTPATESVQEKVE